MDFEGPAKRQRVETPESPNGPLQGLLLSPLLDLAKIITESLILSPREDDGTHGPSSLRGFAQTSKSNLQFVDNHVPFLRDMILLTSITCDQDLVEKMYESMKNGSSRCFVSGEHERLYPSLWDLLLTADILYPFRQIKSPWTEVSEMAGWSGFPDTVFCDKHYKALTSHIDSEGITCCSLCAKPEANFSRMKPCSVCNSPDLPAPFKFRKRVYCGQCINRRPLIAMQYTQKHGIGYSGANCYDPYEPEEWDPQLESDCELDDIEPSELFLYVKDDEYGVRVFTHYGMGVVCWNFVGRRVP